MVRTSLAGCLKRVLLLGALGLALAGQAPRPAGAIGLANILLGGDLEIRSRQASELLARALSDFNLALATLEAQGGGQGFLIESAAGLFSGSAQTMRAIADTYGDVLRSVDFFVAESDVPLLQAWLAAMGREYTQSGYDVFFAYIQYIEDTIAFVIANGMRELSPAEAERLVAGMGVRIGYLYQVGAVISAGFRPR